MLTPWAWISIHASSALLSRVAGLSAAIAENIVAQRNRQGAFKSRKELLEVSRLGPKTFEQCAGFLRISNAENPLDASAVHPEAYTLVERIAKQNSRDVKGLIGDSTTLKALKPADFGRAFWCTHRERYSQRIG